jgi:hypothetical protein
MKHALWEYRNASLRDCGELHGAMPALSSRRGDQEKNWILWDGDLGGGSEDLQMWMSIFWAREMQKKKTKLK